jgi:hypothetical protein
MQFPYLKLLNFSTAYSYLFKYEVSCKKENLYVSKLIKIVPSK